MTRAKYRVYVPVLCFSENSSIGPGEASPLDLFLARFGNPCTFDVYEKINYFKQEDLIHYLSDNAPSDLISYSLLQKNSFSMQPYKSEAQSFLQAPSKIDVPGEARFIHSFTSLSKNSSAKLEKPLPHDYTSLIKNVHTLPVGSETGNLLHKCLEHLDFAACKTANSPKDLETFLYPYIRSTIFEDWKDVLLEMLFSAVKIPFIEGDALSQVSENCLSKECEFLYEDETAYIKGVMDLFFFHRGKYYLLDWKSNWLGEHSLCYQEKSLKIAMEQNDYFLQATLYQKALKKYLKLTDPRPFEDIFGGIYYIFLRGLPESQSIQPNNSNYLGVFWKRKAF